MLVLVAGAMTLGNQAGAVGGDAVACAGADSLGSINHAPLAVDDEIWVRPGEASSVDVLANDRDFDGDEMTVTDVLPAGHGTAELDDAGEVVFTSAPDFEGFDVFSYVVTDGRCGTHDASVRVQVSQDPPPPDKATPEPPVVGVVTFTG